MESKEIDPWKFDNKINSGGFPYIPNPNENPFDKKISADKKIKLYSDYRDFYDIMFDREGESFIRYSVDYFSRRDCFKLLEACGIKTVTHGLVKDLLPYYANRTFLIYLDEKAHATEGKLLVNGDKTLYNDYYASVVEGIPALSYRILNIGNRQWELRYESDDVFYSNKGNVDITLVAELSDKLPSPLHGRNFWAIDFIKTVDGMKACDFNSSPTIAGTPIEKLLSATEIVDLIKCN